MNLLDWIEAEQQKPVLAHELTHALQDQSFGLEKYMKAGAADLATSKKEPTLDDIENDEASTAHQAVVEGQAMVVLIDYELSPTGQSVINSPQIVEALKAGMLVGTPDSVEFHNAPVYIKEALTFPYRYGLDFETELLTKMGKDKAYAGVFKNPPRSTREIMEPATYLSGEKLPPMPMIDFERFQELCKFDVGAVGEFDAAILIDQYAGVDVSKRLYPHWRGRTTTRFGSKVIRRLLWVCCTCRAGRVQRKLRSSHSSIKKDSRDAICACAMSTQETKDNKAPDDTSETLTGKHAWLTEEGPVKIEVKGDSCWLPKASIKKLPPKSNEKSFRAGLWSGIKFEPGPDGRKKSSP